MELKNVISKKNLPTRSPILATVVYVLAMDYWNAPQWFWGAIVLIMVFIWIVWAVSFFTEKEIDIMTKPTRSFDDAINTKKKSIFQERLKEVIKEKQ